MGLLRVFRKNGFPVSYYAECNFWMFLAKTVSEKSDKKYRREILSGLRKSGIISEERF